MPQNIYKISHLHSMNNKNPRREDIRKQFFGLG